MTFLPEQIGKFIGQNVIMVLTFFFFEPYRGSRGLPLVSLDCFMYFFHFRISAVATYKPSLGPFLGPKKKTSKPRYVSQNHFWNQYDFSPEHCRAILRPCRCAAGKNVTFSLGPPLREVVTCLCHN